jgi:hypothetical protein
MNRMPPPLIPPRAPEAFAEAPRERMSDEEVPLGWECANPALQIERWGLDDSAAHQEPR